MAARMITYEVTVEVDNANLARLDAYMTDKHIPEVMATGYFLAANYCQDGGRRRTLYEAADQESLNGYLDTEAERLRQDFAVHFPSGVTATREIWCLLASF